ncbi:hypothetical protein LAW34_21290, partial [Escherichia coli]|nr:hypothetical protein [Escherichia coli]
GKNSLNRLIRCVCGKKIGPDPRNFNQRVSLGRNDLLIRTFPNRGGRSISLDLPTSHIAFSPQITDEFTGSMIKAINSMMMDMLAAIARKDYQDRRRRQAEGIKKAKEEGKYRGRQADSDLHEKIYQLRVINKLSISDTAKLTNVSDRTVIRVAKKLAGERSAG